MNHNRLLLLVSVFALFPLLACRGDKGFREPCTKMVECKLGFSCSREGGICIPDCRSDADCLEGWGCELPAGVTEGYCRAPLCDPQTQAPCAPSEACYRAVLTEPRCRQPGTKPIGAACEFLMDCVKGANCVAQTDGVKSCVGNCDPTQGERCDAGLCTPFLGVASCIAQ